MRLPGGEHPAMELVAGARRWYVRPYAPRWRLAAVGADGAPAAWYDGGRARRLVLADGTELRIGPPRLRGPWRVEDDDRRVLLRLERRERDGGVVLVDVAAPPPGDPDLVTVFAAAIVLMRDVWPSAGDGGNTNGWSGDTAAGGGPGGWGAGGLGDGGFGGDGGGGGP